MKIKTRILSNLISVIGIMSLSTSAYAIILGGVDGVIADHSEYQFNTDLSPNSKHNTNGLGIAGSEVGDGSGGANWDIKYFGTDVDYGDPASTFRFGAIGGNILSGQNSYGSQNLFLGDIAINVLEDDEDFMDPTINGMGSSGWDYAVRLLSVSGTEATFEFLEFVTGSSWEGSNIYNRAEDGSQGHVTETYQMANGLSKGTFTGKYSANGGNNNVLEGSFDLSLLSLFDETTGGKIITYLTMSCVNDEVMVHSEVSAVPLPSSIWLFGTALIGFIGISRRTRV